MKRAAAVLAGIALGALAGRALLRKPKPHHIPLPPDPACSNCGGKAYQLFGGWCWACEDKHRT